MKNNNILIDKAFYQKFLTSESFKENLISGIPIPVISNKEVTSFFSGYKKIHVIRDTSPHSHVQYRLNKYFFPHIPLNSAAKAFVKGGSYLKFLEPHINGSSFCRLDICSFFNSISFDYVEESLSPYIKDEFIIDNKQKLVEAVLNSIGFKDEKINKEEMIIPMGFRTSPAISNIIFRKMDILIQSFCSKKNIIFSRYADDMLFSTSKESKILSSDYFFNEIASLLSIMNFKINDKKYISREKEISLNGYVIENKGGYGASGSIRLSNKKMMVITKVMYALNNNIPAKTICLKYLDIKLKEKNIKFENKKSEFEKRFYRDQLLNYLGGYRSYLISLLKFNSSYGCIRDKFTHHIIFILNDIQLHMVKIKKKI
ncbi:reverse transcriptase domain-containing protein [Pantoea allii]|uniref:reverse transcriptase domain-containing protein n=1 Tax=Pantoea allii TaxID=574096 RepID=UPI003D7B99ED